MATVTLPYTLTAGTPENVNNLVSNLNALVTGVNTIDTAQIATGAVTSAKLAAAPFAKLSRTTNQTITTGGLGTALLAVTSTSDNGVATTGTAMNDTTNSRIYARRTGFYAVMGSATFATGSYYKIVFVQFSDAQTSLSGHAPSDSITGNTATTSGVVLLTAGTYINGAVYHQRGVDDTVQGFITMAYLGQAV